MKISIIYRTKYKWEPITDITTCKKTRINVSINWHKKGKPNVPKKCRSETVRTDLGIHFASWTPCTILSTHQKQTNKKTERNQHIKIQDIDYKTVELHRLANSAAQWVLFYQKFGAPAREITVGRGDGRLRESRSVSIEQEAATRHLV